MNKNGTIVVVMSLKILSEGGCLTQGSHIKYFQLLLCLTTNSFNTWQLQENTVQRSRDRFLWPVHAHTWELVPAHMCHSYHTETHQHTHTRRSRKMVQWVKALMVNSDNLSSRLKAHIKEEGENWWLHRSHPPASTCWPWQALQGPS